MARRSEARRRHARRGSFERLARRAGDVSGDVIGAQSNVVPSRRLQYFIDAEARLTAVENETGIFDQTVLQDPTRTNIYTFEEVDAATLATDIGLTDDP